MARITVSALKYKYPEWNIITVQGSDDEDRILNFDVPNVENPPEESDWPTIQKEYEDYLKSIQYQSDRLKEYPSLQECIHAILDDDLEALQAKRSAVKAKYPKPE